MEREVSMNKELIVQILTAYTNYQGSSFFMLFFLCSLLYLYFIEEKNLIDGRRNYRMILFYLSIGIVFLFLFPPFAWIVTKILGDEIYYRTIWLFPIGLLNSYVAVRILQNQNSIKKKIVLMGMLTALVITGGTLTYSHSNYTKAENSYKLPQVVIDLCDAIAEEGMNVKAAFPRELVTYVRQYDSTIILAFGREKLLTWFGGDHELHYALQDQVLDTENVTRILREQECKYLILPEDQKLKEPFSQYGFFLYEVVENYVIYKDLSE